MKIRFLPSIFFMIYAVSLVVASCQSQNSPNDTDCEPSGYFYLDNPFLEEAALVTCANGATVKPFSRGDLIIVPVGGIHALYLHSHSEWTFPANTKKLDAEFIRVFAGSCAVELGCLVEANSQGFPAEENRIQPNFSRLDNHTLRIEFELPDDKPMQVMVGISFCRLWDSPDYCFAEGESGGNVGAELAFVFRYETIEHIEALPSETH